MDDGKVCVTCGLWRGVDQYNRRAKAKDGLQARCRSCSAAWYVANRETHKRNTSHRQREAREEYHRRSFAYLDQHLCVDCGETDLVVLEFDHLEGEEKVREVASLVSALVAWRTVEAEIAKCDVRCANCHRRTTALRADQRRHRVDAGRAQERREAATDRLRRLLPRTGAAP